MVGMVGDPAALGSEPPRLKELGLEEPGLEEPGLAAPGALGALGL